MNSNKRITELLEQYIENSEIAGAALIVRKKGNIVCRATCGYADVEKELPVTEQTIFRLASMTKPIIAIATMILVEQGKISLDDLISNYIPAFKNVKVANKLIGFEMLYEADPNNPLMHKTLDKMLKDMDFVPADKEITIIDILNHSSGIGQGVVSMGPLQACIDPNDALTKRVEKIADVPCDFQPGTMTGYSAMAAFEVLGRIIEIASGVDLNTFLQENIFKPLEIRDISYVMSDEQKKRIAKLYESKDGILSDVTESDELWKVVNPLRNGYFSGSAGLFGTLEDYDKIAQMLYNKGELNGVRILQEDTVLKMSKESADHHKMLFPGAVWGLGMVVMEDVKNINRFVGKGTYGWSGAYGTHFYIDPLNKIQTVLMINRSNIGGADSYVSKKLEEVVYNEFVR